MLTKNYHCRMATILPSSEDDFLQLALNLLEFKGFKIHGIFDATGPDGGRDIEAFTFETDATGTTEAVKWWVELKYRGNVKSSLGVKDISSKLRRAALGEARKFLIITNVRTTQQFFQAVSQIATQERIGLRIWDYPTLQRLQRSFSSEPLGRASRFDASAILSDRLEELQYLTPIIESGIRSIICLSGSAGVGKSALVRYIMRHYSRSFSCGLVDCRLNADFGLLLKMLANQFQMKGIKSPFAASAELQLLERQRKDLLLEHCEKTPSLLVLDNFEYLLTETSDISSGIGREVIEHFLTNPMNGSVLILVSRSKILDQRIACEQDYEHFELRGWDIDFVLNDYLPYLQYLDTRLSEIEDKEEEKKQVLDIFRGNPLALKMANQLCAHYQLGDIISFMRRGSSDAAAFLVSMLAQELDNEQRVALQRFAFFNRPLSEDEILSFACRKEVLETLKFRNLVEPVSYAEKQYQIHPLTAQRALELTTSEERQELARNLLASIRGHISTSGDSIDSIYNHGLLRQAVAMLTQEGLYEDGALLLAEIGTRAVSMGDVDYLESMLKILAIESPSDCKVTALTAAKLLKVKGHIYDLRANHSEAERVYELMLQRGIALNDPWVRAAALNGLGSIERYRGLSDKAISLYVESLSIRTNIDDLAGQANSLHNLGAVYLEIGDLPNAQLCLERAQNIRRSLGDFFRASATELYLAECYIHLGELDKARAATDSCIMTKERLRDTVGLLWARLTRVKADLVGGDAAIVAGQTLPWCVECAQLIRYPRGEMLAKVMAGAHELLLSRQSEKGVRYLIEAQRIARDLNQLQSALIEEMIKLHFTSSDTDDFRKHLKKLIIGFKI